MTTKVFILLVLLVLLFFLVVCPFVVYLIVKCGTFAFYRGRQLFKQFEENHNGEKKKT